MLLAARRGPFLARRALSSSHSLLLSSTRRQMITVTGHLAPDTDAVCAALVRASHLQRLQGVEARAVRLGPLNGETACVLEMLGIDVPPLLEEAELQTLPEASVAIVDTNNADELLKGLKGSQLHSIVDHHKLVGNLATPAPIDIDIRPLCSTGSVLFQRLKAVVRFKHCTSSAWRELWWPLGEPLLRKCVLYSSVACRTAKCIACHWQ
jgi:manganese-dependent inorganic pyrophosphatase